MAIGIMEAYRQSGMLAYFYGIADEKDLISLGKDNGMTHVLHFVDGENIKMVSVADEMGGFTVDITVDDLIMPK